MKKWILVPISIVALVAIGVGVIIRAVAPQVPPPLAGHIHMTDGGGYREIMDTFVRDQFDLPVSIYITGSSGDLRDYMRVALAKGSIGRGTLFSYNHLEVHRQFEAARPFVAEFPGRFPVREEFAELVDPKGELHVVWVDAIVIIYNPGLISREKVPSTLGELARFDQKIGVPTTGCIGTWGKMALYYHLGEENFKKLMANAAVKSSIGDVTTAVWDGTVAVGISTLMDVMVRDGDVGVIWPEDGAIAKPALMVIPDNPTDYHLRLADIIMSPEAAELFTREFNMASALPDGPVPAIVDENDFNFIFIPAQAIICEITEKKVNRIVGD
ncbi:MAG: hypothetical protein DDT29_02256 [Dehalococcoidia bacterium]|nr:hypothetical protein [Bacillota bacterium]